MALKLLSWITLASVGLAACGGSASSPDTAAPEPPPHSVTHWSEQMELFAEYPRLVVGQTSRFAIHLTHLDPFKPAADGEVEVRLVGDAGKPEVFRVSGPSQPGIFGVDVQPTQSGARRLIISYRSRGIEDEHEIGAVEIHADAASALAAAPTQTPDEGVRFLKEQQWTLDFNTEVVREQAIRSSTRVPAEVTTRSNGAADAVAPVGGRLVTVAELALGAPVTRGQTLARLQPPPTDPSDLPELERARADAAAAGEFARRDRERAERLVGAGAAPEKRLEEARVVEAQAGARLAAAEAQLVQSDASRAAEGGSNERGLFIVRAPITGVIAAREAATGANVAAGARLFQIVDAALVQIVGQVPEAQLAQARGAQSAQLEVPGSATLQPVGRRISVGRVLDPQARTLPIVFALDNRALGLPIGQAVFLHLFADQAALSPVIPLTAVIDDGGRPIVFVQMGGETFERRPVTLGAREGDVVQVRSGVQLGERVVTKGAYLIRLASLSTQVPAHGHVH